MRQQHNAIGFVIEQWHTRKNNIPLLAYASDVLGSLGISEEEELIASIKRARQACRSLSISIDKHFVHIYRAKENELISDWKLSALACYLLTINANPTNPNVAKAQLFFLLKISTHVKI